MGRKICIAFGTPLQGGRSMTGGAKRQSTEETEKVEGASPVVWRKDSWKKLKGLCEKGGP